MALGAFQFASALTASTFLLLACSAADNGGAVKILKGSDSEEIQPDQEATLEIESSNTNLKGSKVTAPPGALAVGSVLDMKPTGDQPAAFANTGVTTASDPISITATGPNGEAVTETKAPLAIELPIANTALALLAEESELCVFLEWAGDQSLYVWRRSSFKVENAKAKFQSTKLGIFQLVYCGSNALEGEFKDAQNENIAGTASEAFITLKLSSDESTFKFRFDHTHICTGIAADNAEGKTEIWNYGDQPHTPGTAAELKIYKGGVKDISELGDSTQAYIFVIFQNASQTCDPKLAEGDKVVGNGLFVWNKLGSEVKAGTLAGTLGDTNGSFGLETFTLKVGRTDGGTEAASADADACIGSDVSGSSGGFVNIVTKIGSGNTIGGGSSQSLYQVYTTNSAATKKQFVTLNSKRCEDKDESASTDTATTQPYSVFFRGASAGSTLALTPVDATINVPALYPLTCLQVFPKSSSLSAKSESDRAKILTASLLVKQGATSTYKLYLPFIDGGHYDLGYKMYTSASANCTNSADLFVPKENQPLNNSIQISYP